MESKSTAGKPRQTEKVTKIMFSLLSDYSDYQKGYWLLAVSKHQCILHFAKG
jgi:hypothetical protein